MSPSLVPIGEVADFNPSAPKASSLKGSEVAFVPMASVGEDGTMRVGSHRDGGEISNGYSYFQDGDVVVAKITPCYENNKIAAVQIDRDHGFGSTEFHVLRPRAQRLNARYLSHFLRQDAVRALGQKRMTGSAGQRRVPRQFLEQLEIPLPALDEQMRIANILDRADVLRRKRRKGLELLDELPSKLFADTFGDMIENERNWPIVQVRHFVERFESGKNLASDDQDDPDAAFRVLKVSAVTSLRFKSDQSKALPTNYTPPIHHMVRRGDLLFSRANTAELIGATAFVDENLTGLVMPDKIWRFVWHSEKKTEPFFVWFLFRQKSFRDHITRHATGTSGSMKNISQAKVLDIEVGFPSLTHQEFFAMKVRKIINFRSHGETQENQLDDLFSSLQHRAFRGEL